MEYNNTQFTPEQCTTHALFLNTMNQSAAFVLWMNILFIAAPYTLAASWWCAAQTRDAYKTARQRRGGECDNTRPFFGTTEKWFCACTVFLGVNVMLFLVLFLAIQAQRYCSGGPISDASYIALWISQGVLVGGIVATAFLSWLNSLMAVWGKEDVLCNSWVLKWEAYIILSPFILITMGFVLLVKGPAACGELRFVKAFREWRSARSHPMAGLKNWMRRPAERSWWGGKKREVFVDLEKPAASTNFEKRHWPRSPLGWKEKMNTPAQSPAAAPPPYALDNPLS